MEPFLGLDGQYLCTIFIMKCTLPHHSILFGKAMTEIRSRKHRPPVIAPSASAGASGQDGPRKNGKLRLLGVASSTHDSAHLVASIESSTYTVLSCGPHRLVQIGFAFLLPSLHRCRRHQESSIVSPKDTKRAGWCTSYFRVTSCPQRFDVSVSTSLVANRFDWLPTMCRIDTVRVGAGTLSTRVHGPFCHLAK
jgi:hypothetical protein